MTSDDALPLVGVTGAAGRVGRLTARALAGRYRLRLIDLEWPDDPSDDPLDAAVDDAERVSLDLRDAAACAEAVESLNLLVHLAGQPSPEIEVREAVEDVAMPTALLAEAVRESGLRRFVYASSIHSMGLYHRDGRHPIDPTWPARPCCEYGSAKVLGENLLGLLVERTPITVACLRLGLTGARPTSAYQASQWLGDDDFGQLLRGALSAEVSFGAYFGVSTAGLDRWDIGTATQDLGYEPTQVPDPPEDPATDGPSGGICLMR